MIGKNGRKKSDEGKRKTENKDRNSPGHGSSNGEALTKKKSIRQEGARFPNEPNMRSWLNAVSAKASLHQKKKRND